MAKGKTVNTKAMAIVREEDLEDMREVLKDLQGRLDKASEDGRVYLMSHLIRAVSMFKVEAARLEARFDRELLAQHRKAEKELRRQLRAQQDGEDNTQQDDDPEA